MQTCVITTFKDIVDALRANPEWREEMRRLILTEDLLLLPKRFDDFVEKEFKPLKEDVDRLKKEVEMLKKDVETLKRDVADLKGDNYERKVREKAPSFFGKLLRKVKTINIEQYAEVLDDANERGEITDEERESALNIDVVVRGRIKETGKEIILAGEVSITVDVKDVERASKRAEVFTRAFGQETIGVVIGQQITDEAKKASDNLAVLVL
ncbi:MAG: hypothetical protein SNJ53_07740 [Thermodesulfovibrionales bacterium]